MKQGRSLSELAGEIERQAAAKVDFLAPTTAIDVGVQEGRAVLRLGEHEVEVPELGIDSYAHGQVSDVTGVPKRYYDRILQQYPNLWATTVNTLLHANQETRLVRTLDGNVRAFLSRSYRRLDNVDLANAVLPVLSAIPDLRIASAEITPRNMFIKVVRDTVTGEVRKGDVVRLGLMIRNSEVGCGAAEATPLVERLICLNGAVVNDWATRGVHLGRTQDTDQVRQLMSGEALRAEDRAFFLKMRDVIRQVLSGSVWQEMLASMQKAAGEPVTGNPVKVVEKLVKDYQLSEDTGTSVLRFLRDHCVCQRPGGLRGGDGPGAVGRQGPDPPVHGLVRAGERCVMTTWPPVIDGQEMALTAGRLEPARRRMGKEGR